MTRRRGGLVGEAAEAKLGEAALGPEVREQPCDLGPREREHHERAVGEVARGGVDELDAREIAPVEILEDEQDRAAATTRASSQSSQARRI